MNQYDILKQYFGHTDFRKGQQELIGALLSGRDVFGVMSTGAGKSLCYQIPALMLKGITFVVSPLVSLMKDQVNDLTLSGVKAAYLNSSLTAGQYATALKRAMNGEYKIIYVAPERLMTEGFLEYAKGTEIAMVIVDEAHCVSQWGQDFRPSYLKIAEFIESLRTRPAVGAFTATATSQVREDVIRSLRLKDPLTIATGFDRANLYFEVRRPEHKSAALRDILKRNMDKSGIVYCATRKCVEEVCAELNRAGFSATRYHAGLGGEERQKNQDDFIFDRKTVMVATNAFGMGIDKSNVSFVVHYNMPKNLESYYQEAGRAGRDGERAECILLYGGQDVVTNKFLIESSPENNAELSEEMRRMIIQRDMQRLKQMTFYATTTDCLREYILRYFGDRAENFCGNCSNCNTHFESADITLEAQKIVSCVSRIARRNRSFGKAMIAEILRGGKSERIKKLGLEKLSTYGIMADTPVHRIREMLDFLIQKGYLAVSDGEYPVICLSDRSDQIIHRKTRVEMKLPRERITDRIPKTRTEYDVDGILLAQLKSVRNQLAAKARVPAYIVFTDASMADMCRKLPRTMEEFMNVSGVGKVKAERYGALFTELIRGCVSGKNTSAQMKAAEKPDAEGSSGGNMKAERISAYRPWTEAEDEKLKKGFAEGLPVRELSAAHNRTEGAIRARLKKHGVL